MEATDLNTLSLNLDCLTEVRKSQTSLLSGASDDPGIQLNDVS